jgi:hypothetical protein
MIKGEDLCFKDEAGVLVLMMFSQLGDKESTPPPVPSTAPEQTAPKDYGSIIFGVIILLFIVGCLAIVILVAIPEGAKNNLRKEAEHQASIDGPKALAELVGEMRLLRSEVSLLRLAAENLAAQ